MDKAQQTIETPQQTIEIKPTFKPEAIEKIFEMIKDFFSIEHQTELKSILKTGNNANIKLLFKDNGNRLTDTFKKLKEHDFITCCDKQTLIDWIVKNFEFMQQSEPKPFKTNTVKGIINKKTNPCKSPIIEIENAEIIKNEIPRNKTMNN